MAEMGENQSDGSEEEQDPDVDAVLAGMFMSGSRSSLLLQETLRLPDAAQELLQEATAAELPVEEEFHRVSRVSFPAEPSRGYQAVLPVEGGANYTRGRSKRMTLRISPKGQADLGQILQDFVDEAEQENQDLLTRLPQQWQALDTPRGQQDSSRSSMGVPRLSRNRRSEIPAPGAEERIAQLVEVARQRLEETAATIDRPCRHNVERLRRAAVASDADAARYAELLQKAVKSVSYIKMALYDADSEAMASVGRTASHGAVPDGVGGADCMLSEAREVLETVGRRALDEAAQLQPIVEERARCLQALAGHVEETSLRSEEMIGRRVDYVREGLVKRRTALDTGWQRLHEQEKELSVIRRQVQAKQDEALVQAAGPGDAEAQAMSDKGVTVQGAHAIIRAFALVLKPLLHTLATSEKEPGQWTPSHAVALEFLTAANHAQSKGQKRQGKR